MTAPIKFKCTSCQYVFEHDADEKKCFCPKCGNSCERCEETEQTIVCSECGAEVPVTATSCPACGCPISGVKKHRCMECGTELDDSVHVCPQCGCPVSSPVAVPPIPAVSITQTTASPTEVEDTEQSLPPRSKALYWYIGGVLLLAVVGFGVAYYTTDFFKNPDASVSVTENQQQVVIDGVNLRLRYAPSSDAETFKWSDGTNRHPEFGERYPYLGEEGDFYKINYKGHILYVSKQHTYLE